MRIGRREDDVRNVDRELWELDELRRGCLSRRVGTFRHYIDRRFGVAEVGDQELGVSLLEQSAYCLEVVSDLGDRVVVLFGERHRELHVLDLGTDSVDVIRLDEVVNGVGEVAAVVVGEMFEREYIFTEGGADAVASMVDNNFYFGCSRFVVGESDRYSGVVVVLDEHRMLDAEVEFSNTVVVFRPGVLDRHVGRQRLRDMFVQVGADDL